MASSFKEEYEHGLRTSTTTLYVVNTSFYTTEERVYELFSRAGDIKKIIMGLDTNTPCGFCFGLLYYFSEDIEDVVKYINGTILDGHPICVDF